MSEKAVSEAPSFREMAEALGLGMAFQIRVSPDRQGRQFTYVGDSCRELTGVDPAEALADASRLYGLILPEHQPGLQAAEEAALAAMRPFEAEVRMLGANGDVRWRRLHSTPRAQPDGSTLWDGLLTDVTDQRASETALQEQRRRLQAAVDATGLGLWEWEVRTGALTWTERNRELFDLGPDEPLTIERYQELVHPDDRELIRDVYREAAQKPDGGAFIVEHRIAREREGRPRWLQARGRVVKDDDGVALVVGATLDVTDRKAAEERRTLQMGELAHRAKNGILVMMAMVSQTARSAGTVKELEDVLLARLKALADSQDLITASGGRPVTVADVVARSLQPFDAARFDVDDALADVTVGGETAVSLGLLLHEFSTNAVKYGALSGAAGRVKIRRDPSAAEPAVLLWDETGGPEVRPPGDRKGFGSRLIDIALRQQGGKVEPRFDPAGFRAAIRLPTAPTSRP